MYNSITNKALLGIISEQSVLSECNYNSISVDNPELNLSASLDLSNLDFNFNMWIGSNDEETELTESQKDSVYNLLLNAESQESEFSYNEQEHQLTLIHS